MVPADTLAAAVLVPVRYARRTGKPLGDPGRGWDFVSAGHGGVPWEDVFWMLNSIGGDGPISIEWEDDGLDRLQGAPQALTFLRQFDFRPPAASFDAAFSSGS